jgi:hypothetical protein
LDLRTFTAGSVSGFMRVVGAWAFIHAAGCKFAPVPARIGENDG